MGFDGRKETKFCSFSSGLEAKRASCSMGKAEPFLRVKAAGGVNFTVHFHLVPRYRMNTVHLIILPEVNREKNCLQLLYHFPKSSSQKIIVTAYCKIKGRQRFGGLLTLQATVLTKTL